MEWLSGGSVMHKFKVMKCVWGLPHMDINKGDTVLFLGEIDGMDGHCVVARKDGRIVWGIHSERFEEIPKDDL